MRLEIRTHGMTLDRADLEHLERSMEHALHRFEGRIGRLMVYLSGENCPSNPKATGLDRSVKCVLSMPHSRTVTIAERGRDLAVAIDRAADRAGFAVSRLMSRRKDRRGRLSTSGLPT
jgi:ribosome-associated translation inhibitor RaiA